MSRAILFHTLRILIGAVWLVNGLFCKFLGWVPRHEQIVANILGDDHATGITRIIGLGEIGLGLWVWSGYRSRMNALLQMTLVAIMNTIEFFLAPEQLLWGRFNALFAASFIGVVYVTEIVLKKPPVRHEIS